MCIFMLGENLREILDKVGNILFQVCLRIIPHKGDQPPIQWVPGVLSLEVNRPGRESDYSPSSSAEVK
jgi:hypothetical protein